MHSKLWLLLPLALLPRAPQSTTASLPVAGSGSNSGQGSVGAGDPPTQASITIGGAGSCGSDGFDDPGLLNDGQTAASATYAFTLDPAMAQLTLIVTNTSFVVPGVPNPLLTDVFFNAPAAITDMSLVGQSAAAGQQPNFALFFDAEPGTNPDPNGAGLFGAFGVRLSDVGNVHGAIANPDADTYVADESELAISPVTFTMSLQGDLTGLTAESFTQLLSVIPPGSKPSHGVAKFQSGGKDEASGSVNEGEPCEEGSSVALGDPCGATLTITVPVPGGPTTVHYDGSIPNGSLFLLRAPAGGTPFPFRGCTIFVVNPPTVLGPFATDSNGDFEQVFYVTPGHDCGDEIVVQGFALPSGARGVGLEISNGVLVTLGS